MAKACAWPNCDRPRHGRLCAMHEARRREGRDMDAPPRDRLFDAAEIAWMRVNYPRFTFDESLRLFQLHFGREITRAQWKNAASRYRLGKSHRWEDARFQPGHTPANKGRKGYSAPGSEKGWFKKGHLNNVEHPMYAERWRIVGSQKARILFIKVPGPDPYRRDFPSHFKYHWIRKAVWVWQQAHGPVPKGHAVVQLDGDPANCELGNLDCVPQAVLARLNAYHAPPYAGPEANPARVRMAQIKHAIAEHETRTT